MRQSGKDKHNVEQRLARKPQLGESLGISDLLFTLPLLIINTGVGSLYMRLISLNAINATFKIIAPETPMLNK